MAKYRPILCGFWDDPDIEPFTPEEKLVYLFLFSNRLTTESGIYSISEKFISERTGVSTGKIKVILNTLNTIYRKITIDGNVIFVHGFLKRNYKGRPEFLEKSIIADLQSYPSLSCWTKFVEINRFHSISNKIKDMLNTCGSVANTSYEYDNSNSNSNSNDSEIKEGMQGEIDQAKIIPPTKEMIDQYILDKSYHVDGEKFFDFYESKNWMIGKNKMKNWQASIRTWEKSNKPEKSNIEQAMDNLRARGEL